MKLKKSRILTLFLGFLLSLFIFSSCTERVIKNDEETQIMIKEDYANFFGKDDDNIQLETIDIILYLGIYGTAYVSMLTCKDVVYIAEVWTENIEIYSFKYTSSNRIWVWFEHEFYTLTDAYNKKILDLENISSIYDNYCKI
ncbi:MAG: hypothetical protein K2N40_02410 [Ureaplasma sp.]|nr:hypothetical protein [Ureaplasma sp.]